MKTGAPVAQSAFSYGKELSPACYATYRIQKRLQRIWKHYWLPHTLLVAMPLLL